MDLDVLFRRETVLEIILSGKHISPEVYQLRFHLFLRAAKCCFDVRQKRREVLEPFPYFFYDRDTKQRNYDELESCILSIPQLSTITESTSLPELTWQLIHWIFTNPLKIKNVNTNELSELMISDLREITKLKTIPDPSPSCDIFKITHPIEINSTKIFIQHKKKFGSFFAYHGSPGFNFHSIIHHGLRCSLNLRSAYGSGTYLTSYLETARSYAESQVAYRDYAQHPDPISYCVAIVEVIKHPSIKVVTFGANMADQSEVSKFDDTSSDQHRYYVVSSDEFMRLNHLLVFP